METTTKKSTLVLVVFILGAVVSYVFFTFIQQSDRRAGVHGQLDDVGIQLQLAETIRINCTSLYLSRENTPNIVRAKCVESRAFISWARNFSTDPALRDVRQELLVLANAIEEMTNTISLHPNSTYAKELIDQIPILINTVQEEVSRTRRKILL